MFVLQVLLQSLLLLSATLPHAALGRPAQILEERAIVPAFDPFYIPPSGFASTAPGTILRSRVVVSSLFGLVVNPVLTYQLLYRTTAINGSAIATVTTVFVPTGAKKDQFVSFHTAYDSSATICNPSYNYQLAAVQADLISALETLLLEAYLIEGYIVSSPDYEGPDAAFGPGPLSGMGALDSMRAVANFKSTLGLTTSTPAIVGVGYSGGSIPTGWAAQLQPSYAPELKIKGWAAGGVVANLTGTALYIDNTLFSGFLPAAFDGLNKPSAYYTSLNPVIQSILQPKGRQITAFANQACAPADLLAFLHQSVFSTQIQSLGTGLFYQPTIASVLAQQTMGGAAPIAPVLLYHATPDEIIPYVNTKTLFNTWCAKGTSVHFTTFAAGGHLTTEILGFVNQFKFVQNAFAGTVATSGCATDTVLSNSLDPLALGVQLEPVLVRLANLLLDAAEADNGNITALTG